MILLTQRHYLNAFKEPHCSNKRYFEIWTYITTQANQVSYSAENGLTAFDNQVQYTGGRLLGNVLRFLHRGTY